MIIPPLFQLKGGCRNTPLSMLDAVTTCNDKQICSLVVARLNESDIAKQRYIHISHDGIDLVAFPVV
jgi:hypothetical protein